MRVSIKKFGDILTSRQSGREAYAAFLPTLSELTKGEEVVLDFEGVSVLSPSWADEFLTPLLKTLGKYLVLTHVDNPSVRLTREVLEGILKQTFTVRP